ncbi:uncharacterized protein BXZ73DRAFT_76101 [Epithele typhae]|uniref:uncharacterized protein n=1 Tax=Epithele typhae TaxID=378194 RepID=UPI002008807E|nr:uncharacterized protein BXZ73DRAFT_76101 [Epithele typhae]KAH9939403.1 hypothetical protein BXZ73DRAFT_76101 [Epithele typhae]
MPTDKTPLPDIPPLALAHTLHSLDLTFPSGWLIEHREHVARIVTRLQAFPALRTLCLRIDATIAFQEKSALHLPPSYPRATLPNIRNLTILSWSPQPVPECPHVEELTLGRSELYWQSAAGLRWSPLHALTILYDDDYDWPTRRGASCIKRASRLWFNSSRPNECGIEQYEHDTGKLYWEELPGLSTFLFSCTLLWFLDLSGVQTGRNPEGFTDNETALARVAARLRSLHIDVHPSALLKDASWDTFAVLAAAPLVHLTLVLAPRDHKSDAEVPSSWAAEELARVRVAREIPRRLAESIATLRVLQVGDAMPHAAWLPPQKVQRADDEDDGSDESWRSCLREMAEMEVVRRRRWWWIERKDGSAAMTEMWREDGERARDLVEEDGFDRATGLDGRKIPNIEHVHDQQTPRARPPRTNARRGTTSMPHARGPSAPSPDGATVLTNTFRPTERPSDRARTVAAAPLVHLGPVLVPRDPASDGGVPLSRGARAGALADVIAITTLRVRQIGDAEPEREAERLVAGVKPGRRRRWWWIQRKNAVWEDRDGGGRAGRRGDSASLASSCRDVSMVLDHGSESGRRAFGRAGGRAQRRYCSYTRFREKKPGKTTGQSESVAFRRALQRTIEARLAIEVPVFDDVPSLLAVLAPDFDHLGAPASALDPPPPLRSRQFPSNLPKYGLCSVGPSSGVPELVFVFVFVISSVFVFVNSFECPQMMIRIPDHEDAQGGDRRD